MGNSIPFRSHPGRKLHVILRGGSPLQDSISAPASRDDRFRWAMIGSPHIAPIPEARAAASAAAGSGRVGLPRGLPSLCGPAGRLGRPRLRRVRTHVRRPAPPMRR